MSVERPFFERDEALLEELGHQAAIRVENTTWKTQLNMNQQNIMFDFWKRLRYKCYDIWMDEIDNDALAFAHGRLQEAVTRCRSSVRERSSHVKNTAVCHEEIVMAFEKCRDSSAKRKQALAERKQAAAAAAAAAASAVE
eukprot:TRINITY_DN29844_c0_g1_i1.p1 TRINITY_DN29844_c0_g1~~TRINITY_DN29844_c0_g1_i1.p1  ORF type:complete len:156 (-),score=29.25 TRINITY_DN29844_c0_g1_i1:43-462(-)